MPIYTRSTGTSFKPAPAGAHGAVCCDIVDLGELEVTYAGKTKKQHKIKVVWQIEELRDDGKPFTVSNRYTNSLHEKSNMRKDLESLRGKPFTEEELRGFDLEVLLAKACMVNVMHNQKDGSTYANVTTIMRLPKGMAAPTVRDYVRECDRKPEDQASQEHGNDWDAGPLTDDDVPF